MKCIERGSFNVRECYETERGRKWDMNMLRLSETKVKRREEMKFGELGGYKLGVEQGKKWQY